MWAIYHRPTQAYLDRNKYVSWWVPEVYTGDWKRERSIRMFKTREHATRIFNSWLRGGVTKSVRISDLNVTECRKVLDSGCLDGYAAEAVQSRIRLLQPTDEVAEEAQAFVEEVLNSTIGLSTISSNDTRFSAFRGANMLGPTFTMTPAPPQFFAVSQPYQEVAIQALDMADLAHTIDLSQPMYIERVQIPGWNREERVAKKAEFCFVELEMFHRKEVNCDTRSQRRRVRPEAPDQ